MAWIFERTVETAAWVSLVVAWASLGLGLWWLMLWFGTLQTEPDYQLLRDATKSLGAFVGFSVALGVLACVDRFLFDAEADTDQPE
ncbi:MAG: hypothetical protein AAFV43_04980 [Planctomycetota bacterium]